MRKIFAVSVIHHGYKEEDVVVDSAVEEKNFTKLLRTIRFKSKGRKRGQAQRAIRRLRDFAKTHR